jgi:general nucleoside transport system ATP-binding protein
MPSVTDMPGEISLKLHGVTKAFGPTVANRNISLTLREGNIHVLLGENGAGKSTLLNIMYGHLQPDEGWIEVFGRRREIAAPSVALECGIGLIHQHFTLVPSFTVVENILLGKRSSLPSNKQTAASVGETAEQVGWKIDLNRRVSDLSISGRQHVEILKLLHHGARILLMDEPTSLLSPKEIDSFLTVVEKLAANGKSILLVTHKLKEVTRSADTVTVIRHGSITAEFDAQDLDETALARAMTGKKEIPKVTVSGEVNRTGVPALQVQNLSVESQEGMPLKDINIEVFPGEIVGLAGVEGNGQDELTAAIAGLLKPRSGAVRLSGADVTFAEPRRRRSLGLAIVPADRRGAGIVSEMSVFENFALNKIGGGQAPWIKWGDLKAQAVKLSKEFDVRPANIELPAGRLSGGNVQKVVLARELSSRPRILVASSPTWGLDIGAIADVRERLLVARRSGCAILLNSPDLDEILELSDRIVVMYRGVIQLNQLRWELNIDQLSLAMIGR